MSYVVWYLFGGILFVAAAFTLTDDMNGFLAQLRSIRALSRGRVIAALGLVIVFTAGIVFWPIGVAVRTVKMFKFALLLLLAGCSLFKGHDDKPQYIYTPMGRPCLFMNGGWTRGVTDAQVLSWGDARIEEWIEKRKAEYGEQLCRNVANSAIYELVDHFRFESIFSPTGYAEGTYEPQGTKGRRIRACLYTKAEAAVKPASVPYPDMIEFRDSLWKWAVFPADGVGFAVLPHELDHGLGIGH